MLDALKTKGIAIRVASPKLVMEEAPESYKVQQGLSSHQGKGVLVSLLACTIRLFTNTDVGMEECPQAKEA